MMIAMDIVEFLEARTAEQESALREGSYTLGVSGNPDNAGGTLSLREHMLEECAQQRAIIAAWKEAADDEGITDPSQATGTIAIARRAMLILLAGAHRDHPDYNPDWAPELPTHTPGGPSTE